MAGLDGHWVSIQLRLTERKLEVFVIDPLCFNSEPNQVVATHTSSAYLLSIISQWMGIRTQRQQDVISCGAIVVDDICRLVSKQPLQRYEKGAVALRKQHMEDVPGLRDMLLQDLQHVNTGELVLPKAPEMTTDLEQLILQINSLVSDHSEVLETLLQVGTENVPELKQLIFLLDDLAPLRAILFKLDHMGHGGECDYPFKEQAITNLSIALNLFNPSNQDSLHIFSEKKGRKLARYDSNRITN